MRLMMLWIFSTLPPGLAQVDLDRTEFPAAGVHETLLHITEVDRYSLWVESGRGVRIALFDRMFGPMMENGAPGASDGRLDVLLDEGTYKVRLEGPTTATGKAVLKAQRFRPGNTNWESLRPDALHQTQLEDRQQRHFWVVVPEPGMLRLEIMGRNLSDARLWLPGRWLSGIRPTFSDHEPVPGKPMAHVEFHHRVNAGQYLLTCYGGPPKAWAEEDNSHPLYLRRGIKRAGESGYHRITVSPFGRESILVPGFVSFREIIRKEKRDTQLLARDYDETASRYSGYANSAEINKNTRAPHALIQGATRGQFQWLEIRAEPGAQIELQHFVPGEGYFPPGHAYLITSQSGFNNRSVLEPSLVVSKSDQDTPVADQSVRLGKYNHIGRRTNLLRDVKLLLEVTDQGEYVLELLPDSTAEINYRIEPFLLVEPDNYRVAPFKQAGQPFKLTAGFHVLHLNPRRKGILNFSLHHKHGPPAQVTRSPEEVRREVFIEKLDLRNTHYSASAHVFGLNNEFYNLRGRVLPLDLDENLPFSLTPGTSKTFPIETTTRRELMLEGDPLDLQINGRAWFEGMIVESGKHTVRIHNKAQRTGFYQLYTRPPHQNKAPVDLDGWGDIAAQMPRLREGKPLYDNYRRGTPVYQLLEVSKPGLYRVETSGRLATSLYIRNRVNVDLFRGDQNGIGRNGLVQQYLRAGNYLVTMVPQGQSEGRAGIHLGRTELSEGMPLVQGAVRKISLSPDEAVRYPFTIPEDGNYRLLGLGQGRTFFTRIEDQDGFPILTPQKIREVTRYWRKGDYQLYSLPDPVAGRRLFLLEHQPESQTLQGKGPHPIAFNRPVQHLWREGQPDRYTLEIPAPVEATLTVPTGMLLSARHNGETVLEAQKGEVSRLFEAGSWSFQFNRAEADDRFPYQFTLRTRVLLENAPQERRTFPCEISLSLGADALVDITAWGETDLKATLKDAEGKIVAVADDSPDDWNFHISRALRAGRYTLQVDRHGDALGSSLFRLTPRPGEVLAKTGFPFRQTIQPGARLLTLPIAGGEGGLVQLEARGEEQAALALVRDGRVVAEGENQLYVALTPHTDYRLRIWYPRSVGGELDIQGTRMTTRTVSLQKERPRLKGAEAWYLEDPMWRSWRVASSENLLFASKTDEALRPVAGQIVNLFEGKGWLLGGSATLSPLTVPADSGLTVQVGARPMILGLSIERDQPTVVRLQGVAAQPAAMITRTAAGLDPDFSWNTMARDHGATLVAVPAAGNYQLRLWAADPQRPPAGVGITPLAYTLVETLPFARRHESLGPLQAKAFTLTGETHPDLLLAKGLLALLHENGRVYDMAAAQTNNRAVRLNGRGGTLLIINMENQEAVFSLDVGNPIERKHFGGRFEAVYAAPGRTILDVPESGEVLYAFGDHLQTTWQGDDGSYALGGTELPGGAGTLTLDHQGGLVLVWSAPPALKYDTLFGSGPPTPSEAQPGPLTAAGPACWTYTLETPALITLTTQNPAMLALKQGDQWLEVGWGAQHELSRFMQPGRFTLPARAVGALPLDLKFSVAKPEQLPPAEEATPRLIRGGERHVYTFTVQEDGDVGVGLASDQDRISATLYDEASRRLGEGPYLLRKLTVGTYLLVVSARGEPVRYTPLLYGAHGPNRAIPDDILSSFLGK